MTETTTTPAEAGGRGNPAAPEPIEIDVTPADYARVLRWPAALSAIVLLAGIAGLCHFAATRAGGSLAEFAGRVSFERARGAELPGAVSGDLTGLAVAFLLVVGGGLLARGFAAEAGRALRGALAPCPAEDLVEGLTMGPMTVRLDGTAYETEMRLEHMRRHLGSYRPARRRGDLVRLPARNGTSAFFPAGDAARAAVWARALRAARRSADPAGWPLPPAEEGWIRFHITAGTADGLRRAHDLRHGRAAPAVFAPLLLSLLLWALAATLATGALSGGGLPDALAALLLLPLAALTLAEGWRLVAPHFGARTALGGFEDGVGAGAGAVRADAGAVTIRRRFIDRAIAWAALDCVTEVGDHVLLVAGGNVLEVLPNDPALHYAMGTAGLRPAGGPWPERREGRVWHLPSHA